VLASPAAMAAAASTIPGNPKPEADRHTGPMRAW
jgi:hypothetical protein